LAEINALKNSIPNFYETYCTLETANNLTQALTNLNSTLTSYGSENLTAEQLAALNDYKDALKTCIDNLIFNYDNSIPRFFIATKNETTGKPYYNTLTKAIGKVPAQITLVDAGGEVISKDLGYKATIKVRGNATAGGAKKPYNIKFSDKLNLFGFGKSKKWVLLADYYDQTLMRNKIALDLGKTLGLESTMDNKRVEVYVDGAYRGMYLLTEKIERDENRVDIKKKNDFLVEMDWESRREAGNVYLKTSAGKFFRLREPDLEDETDAEKVASTVESVKSKLDEFEDTLKTLDWEQIKNLIDLNSFVNFYILNEYMKSIDFHQLSVYFYYKDKAGKFYAGPAWDFDNSSGNFTRVYQGHSIHSPEGIYLSLCHYYIYLTQIPEFKSAVFKKFAEICEAQELEKIYNEFIDNNISQYQSAIERNNNLWNVSAASYSSKISSLKSWLKARHEWLANYFLNNKIYKEDDGYYYYENGVRTPAGIIKFDNNYYYVGDGGKIATGEFEIDGETYRADDETGILLPREISFDIPGNDTLRFTAGRASSANFKLNIKALYADGVPNTAVNASKCNITWTLYGSEQNILIDNGGKLSVNSSLAIGTYNVSVKAEVEYDGLSAEASKDVTIIVSRAVSNPTPTPAPSPSPTPTPAPTPAPVTPESEPEPEPVQEQEPEPEITPEPEQYNPDLYNDKTAQQVEDAEAALSDEQTETQGMNAEVDDANIISVKDSGLVMGLNDDSSEQEVIAFGANAQPDAKLDGSAKTIAQELADGAKIFNGSESAENLSKVETTFGDLRAFLIEAQNNINNNEKLAASAAPFKAAQAGIYFIKLDLGDTSKLVGKRLNYFAAPFSSNNSQAQTKALKFKSASENNNLNQGKLIDANGSEIIEYQGGDINAVIYIESAGVAYGQFITAQDVQAQDDKQDESVTEQDSAESENENDYDENNNENDSGSKDDSADNNASSRSGSSSGCNALSFNGLPMLFITLALFKRKKL